MLAVVVVVVSVVVLSVVVSMALFVTSPTSSFEASLDALWSLDSMDIFEVVDDALDA
jgi:hypothetical protein